VDRLVGVDGVLKLLADMVKEDDRTEVGDALLFIRDACLLGLGSSGLRAAYALGSWADKLTLRLHDRPEWTVILQCFTGKGHVAGAWVGGLWSGLSKAHGSPVQPG
jgi:hypothetical protein